MKALKFLSVIVLFGGVLFTSNTYASLWGCEVLLCLSNPAGPMAVKECVPPINKLYRAIFKTDPDPFPTCEEANDVRLGGTPGNYAKLVYHRYYDICPSGTVALAPGKHAVQGTMELLKKDKELSELRRKEPFKYRYGVFRSYATGAGDLSYMHFVNFQETSFPTKVCVGKKIGETIVGSFWDDNRMRVGVYDRVIYIKPKGKLFGKAIEVYQENKLIRVVFPN